MKKIDFHGWNNSYALSNGVIDLVVPSQIGPRILSFSTAGTGNLLMLDEKDLGLRDELNWKRYGGHWLLHGPENSVRSYIADNSPVGVEVSKGLVRLRQKREELSKIVKEIDIKLFKDSPRLELVHRLYNHNAWEIPVMAISCTALPLGGTAFFVINGSCSEKYLRLSGQSDFSDKRLLFRPGCVALNAIETSSEEFKAWSGQSPAWVAYWREGLLFVTRSLSEENTEKAILINKDSLEIRIHTPILKLAPYSALEYGEEWLAFKDIAYPILESGIDPQLLSLIKNKISNI